jgi:DNA-binding Lrp family transcriptional regulator
LPEVVILSESEGSLAGTSADPSLPLRMTITFRQLLNAKQDLPRLDLYGAQQPHRCPGIVRESFLACYRVTGGDSRIMRVIASSVEHLESLIDQLSAHGQLTTSIVLSTPVSRRLVTPMKDMIEEK